MRCPSGLAGHGHCTGCIQVLDSSAQFEESGITAQKETTSELGREEEDDDMALNCAWLLGAASQPVATAPLPCLAVPKPVPLAEWHKPLALHQGCPLLDIVKHIHGIYADAGPPQGYRQTPLSWVRFAKGFKDDSLHRPEGGHQGELLADG